MSNKRNRRRRGQRVRAEISRKPTIVTKAKSEFLAAMPAERKRKEEQRYWCKPTKAERLEREKHVRRWLLGRAGNNPPRAPRKPRTTYGRTFWQHSHDA